jgi:hypothetical protein
VGVVAGVVAGVISAAAVSLISCIERGRTEAFILLEREWLEGK